MRFSSHLRVTAIATAALVVCIATLRQTVDARTVAPRAAKTWEVKMTNEGGSVRYDPAEITIQAGDTVKWIIAGGSHNIVFWPDSVPQGAADLLRKAMPDTAGTLQSPRFPNPGDSYSVVFAGMPKGVYKYHCRPHLTRGMVAKITVAE